jgi:hypothetical protein
MFDAVAASVVDDWQALRAALTPWAPDEPVAHACKFSLMVREALLRRGHTDTLDPAVLNELIGAGRALAMDGLTSGIDLQVARFLVQRAGIGAADDPYGDLRLARELAIRVRDALGPGRAVVRRRGRAASDR